MIDINNISFSYKKGNSVINDFSMRISDGSVCGLLGSNGVGKSTLLYLISGLLKPKSGSILCNGFNPYQRTVPFLNNIFIVPEEFSFPDIKFNQYIKWSAPFYPNFNYEQLERLMEMFGLSLEMRLGRLSLGQKKKAMLSFALACNTSILLLDEPTNGLDIPSKRIFRQAVSSCMEDYKNIIISTHQVYDIEKIIDHIIVTAKSGTILNASMIDISEKLRFSFTTDMSRINRALLSLEVPGGANIIENITDPDMETEVNLESLYELCYRKPELVNSLFANNRN